MEISQRMSITSEVKSKIFKEFGGSEKNTGSVEGNIALFSERIDHISLHLRNNKKDHSGERSLKILVGKRKRLLKYLAKKDIETYRKLIDKLNLRK